MCKTKMFFLRSIRNMHSWNTIRIPIIHNVKPTADNVESPGSVWNQYYDYWRSSTSLEPFNDPFLRDSSYVFIVITLDSGPASYGQCVHGMTPGCITWRCCTVSIVCSYTHYIAECLHSIWRTFRRCFADKWSRLSMVFTVSFISAFSVSEGNASKNRIVFFFILFFLRWLSITLSTCCKGKLPCNMQARVGTTAAKTCFFTTCRPSLSALRMCILDCFFGSNHVPPLTPTSSSLSNSWTSECKTISSCSLV